jgi:hypothetical protein
MSAAQAVAGGPWWSEVEPVTVGPCLALAASLSAVVRGTPQARQIGSTMASMMCFGVPSIGPAPTRCARLRCFLRRAPARASIAGAEARGDCGWSRRRMKGASTLADLRLSPVYPR